MKIWKKGDRSLEAADNARRDDLASRRSVQGHEIAVGDLSIDKIVAETDQRSRRDDAVESAKVQQLLREAKVSGTRARLRFNLYESAEIKTLRLSRLRKISLLSLMPFLTGFAAWSTVGVHAGVVKVFQAEPGSGTDIAAWVVEPGLIAVVAFVIILGAILKSMGGQLGGRATAIEITALVTSIMLNLAGAWPKGGVSPETLPAIFGHSVGPLGCAGIALLIAIADDGITKTEKIVAKTAPALDDLYLAGLETAGNVRRLTAETSRTKAETIRTETPAVSAPRLTETPEPVSPETSQAEAETPAAETEPVSPKPSRPVRETETKPSQRETVPVPENESAEARRARVIAMFEAERDAGRSVSGATIAALTGVPKPTVARYIKAHLETVPPQD